MTVRILFADDHAVVRRAVASYLSSQPGFEVVGEVGEAGPPLFKALDDLEPEVLLLDANMPGHELDMVHTVRRLREERPSLRIVVLTAHDRGDYVVGLVRSGAAGFVLKGDSPEMLLRAISIVAKGGEWVSPTVAHRLIEYSRDDYSSPLEHLTERELDVLRAMARGLTNKAIANELFIGEQTVKNHISSIFSKLGVNTRVEAVLQAIHYGVASPLPPEEET